MSPDEFKAALGRTDPNAVDFPLVIDNLLGKIDLAENHVLIDRIYSFFEQHPDDELGMPGGLVHFIESFYPAYKGRLLQSLNLAPNVSAILMTNRILNSELGPGERAEYVAALTNTLENQRASPVVRESAAHFLRYQAERAKRSE
jgi:hypothetical protein